MRRRNELSPGSSTAGSNWIADSGNTSFCFAYGIPGASDLERTSRWREPLPGACATVKRVDCRVVAPLAASYTLQGRNQTCKAERQYASMACSRSPPDSDVSAFTLLPFGLVAGVMNAPCCLASDPSC